MSHKDYKRIPSLRLQIGVAGATTIAEILDGNRVLEHLLLNNCELGDDGVEPIARGE